MTFIRLTTVSAMLLVAGCAYPTEDQRQTYDGLIGHPPADLVRKLGVPTQAVTVGRSQFMDYADATGSYAEAAGFEWGRGGRYRGYGGWGGYASYYQNTCRTTFEIRQDRVAAWATHGC